MANFRASTSRYPYIPYALPPGQDELLEGLARLSPELVMKIAKMVSKDPNFDFDVCDVFRHIYVKWDAYVTFCRPAMLLLLRTGMVQFFVLHVCHTHQGYEGSGRNEF